MLLVPLPHNLQTVIQTHIWSDSEDSAPAAMYLMFYINENGEKVYTLKVSLSPLASTLRESLHVKVESFASIHNSYMA